VSRQRRQPDPPTLDMEEHFCSRHPDRRARAVRGTTWMCRACAKVAYPGVYMTPDGWRFARSSIYDLDAPRVLEPIPEWRGQAELPLLDPVVDELVPQEDEDQEAAEGTPEAEPAGIAVPPPSLPIACGEGRGTPPADQHHGTTLEEVNHGSA
jgi:hypothetical protein